MASIQFDLLRPLSQHHSRQALLPARISDMEVKITLNKALGLFGPFPGAATPPAGGKRASDAAPSIAEGALPRSEEEAANLCTITGKPRPTLRDRLMPDLLRLLRRAAAEYQAETGDAGPAPRPTSAVAAALAPALPEPPREEQKELSLGTIILKCVAPLRCVRVDGSASGTAAQ